MKQNFLVMMILSVIMSNSFGQDLKTINLPAPHKTGGMPLMEALNLRQTRRSFSDSVIELQQVSDLLWAAWGINRPESGRRTAPSARNFQETTLYVVVHDGIYKWDAKENQLLGIRAGDYRDKIGNQPFVSSAPLIILLVADYSKYAGLTKEQCEFYSGIDAGYISQNIYLFCASEKLSTVVMASINRDEIAKLLNLPASQKAIVAQPVGKNEE